MNQPNQPRGDSQHYKPTQKEFENQTKRQRLCLELITLDSGTAFPQNDQI